MSSYFCTLRLESCTIIFQRQTVYHIDEFWVLTVAPQLEHRSNELPLPEGDWGWAHSNWWMSWKFSFHSSSWFPFKWRGSALKWQEPSIYYSFCSLKSETILCRMLQKGSHKTLSFQPIETSLSKAAKREVSCVDKILQLCQFVCGASMFWFVWQGIVSECVRLSDFSIFYILQKAPSCWIHFRFTR